MLPYKLKAKKILTRSAWLLCLLLASFGVRAQNLAGVSGMFNAPTANIMEDGTLLFGANILDKEFGGFDYRRPPVYEWDALALYGTVSFLPFLEAQFRWTHSIGREIGGNPSYAPDRMASIKLRLLNGQEKWYPTVAFGMEDPAIFFGLSSPSYYANMYAVASKKIYSDKWVADLTLGYGIDPRFSWMKRQPERLRQDGIFGGVAIGHKKFKGSEIMVEFDSHNWNIAARFLILKRIQILGGLFDFRELSGGISYRIRIW